MLKKMERLRFTIDDDIILLQEVIGQNPFNNKQNWRFVQENVVRKTGKNFTVRSVREHVVYLLKLYNNNPTKRDLRKYSRVGSEAQHQEKERLLDDLNSAWQHYKERGNVLNSELIASLLCSPTKPNISETESSIDYDGELVQVKEEIDIDDVPTVQEILKRTLPPVLTHESKIVTTNNTKREIVPVRKVWRKPRLIRARHGWERHMRERELKLQEQKLALEERRLKLDEEKFELEKKEREGRLKMEIKERESGIATAVQHQRIINFFMDNFHKNK